MFLDYFALVVLIMGLLLVFYGFIYIHDIPHEIAKKRNHPHTEAIHVACWLSLFTLHAIWPIVYIWAVFRPRPIPIAIVPQDHVDAADLQSEVIRLREQIKVMELAHAKLKVDEA